MSAPTGGTYTIGSRTFDHRGNKIGPPYPLGSPELRQHIADMVWQSQLTPYQRLQVDGDVPRFLTATREDET
ncbi:Uncharacterised protein [Mycolicibacterium vanbaalenii]|uniref:Uncharacterized protein n=1 Tax=Mycolicibacterium vanbaalenii TaxID=110539 RepID=A0A5S9R5M2_MYCVN|nr:hypothetical protein [Mycolicibacterium vanbaalenii]CAA0129301.1 Uncharacterised protein [Mycolicibacterium vanbaalenii]